jgi:hypothetical protein
LGWRIVIFWLGGGVLTKCSFLRIIQCMAENNQKIAFQKDFDGWNQLAKELDQKQDHLLDIRTKKSVSILGQKSVVKI